MGADKTGRDVLSRVIHAARISLTVGLIGVALSLVLGVIIGGISGLVGGAVDNVIQRIIEIINSIPNVPIMLALAAVVPAGTPIVQVYVLHHHYFGAAGLDGHGPRGAGPLSGLARGRLCAGCAAGRRQPNAPHRQAHDSLVSQPHHRVDHDFDSLHDFERDRA